MEKYELIHSGIKGMKWGVRRYQNKDGSLTPAGRKRYGNKTIDDLEKKIADEEKKSNRYHQKIWKDERDVMAGRKGLSDKEWTDTMKKVSEHDENARRLKQELKDATDRAIADGNQNRNGFKERRAAAKAKAAEEREKKEAAERKAKIEAGKMSPKKMTEAELNERIARLDLEKKYTDALKDSKTSHNRTSRFVEKFLDSSIDKIAENATADVVAQAVKVLTTRGVNKAFGSEEVFTNNKKK